MRMCILKTTIIFKNPCLVLTFHIEWNLLPLYHIYIKFAKPKRKYGRVRVYIQNIESCDFILFSVFLKLKVKQYQ